MSLAEPKTPLPAPPPTGGTDTIRPLIDGCPFLASSDGAWRGSTARRDHRCAAVTPPAQLATEKQRRLCLTADHPMCATYAAARLARDAAPARASSLPRPVARMTPVVLDHARVPITVPVPRTRRSTGEIVLAAIIALALAAIVIAKLSGVGGGSSTEGLGSASPHPSGSAIATASSRPAATPSPAPTTAASADGSPAASAGASASPGATASAPSSGRTYKVKSGDTLLAIAAKYGTTTKALMKLNGLTSTSLRIGQILKLP